MILLNFLFPSSYSHCFVFQKSEESQIHLFTNQFYFIMKALQIQITLPWEKLPMTIETVFFKYKGCKKIIIFFELIILISLQSNVYLILIFDEKGSASTWRKASLPWRRGVQGLKRGFYRFYHIVSLTDGCGLEYFLHMFCSLAKAHSYAIKFWLARTMYKEMKSRAHYFHVSSIDRKFLSRNTSRLFDWVIPIANTSGWRFILSVYVRGVARTNKLCSITHRATLVFPTRQSNSPLQRWLT